MSTPKKAVTSFAIKGTENFPPETIIVKYGILEGSPYFTWNHFVWFVIEQFHPKMASFFKHTLWLGIAPKSGNQFPEIHLRFCMKDEKDFMDAHAKLSDAYKLPLKFQKRSEWKKENEGTRDAKYFITVTFDLKTVWDWGTWKKYDPDWRSKEQVATEACAEPASKSKDTSSEKEGEKPKEKRTTQKTETAMQKVAPKDHSWKPESSQLSVLLRNTGLISGKQFGRIKLEAEDPTLTKALFAVHFTEKAYRGALIKEAVKGIPGVSVSSEGSTYMVKIWVSYGFAVESVHQRLLDERTKAVAVLAKTHNESLEKGKRGRPANQKKTVKKVASGKRGRPSEKKLAKVNLNENVEKFFTLITTFLSAEEQAHLVKVMGGNMKPEVTDDMLKVALKKLLEAADMALVSNKKPFKMQTGQGGIQTTIITHTVESLFKRKKTKNR